MRQLDWEGAINVRDLGGLGTRDGGETARGAVVRSGSPDGLSERGWAALRAYGIRTIVDLRNDDERARRRRGRGSRPCICRCDGQEDAEFWAEWAGGPQFGTPLYYLPHLDRFPDRNARVIEAIARAEPGGVLFHCVGGRDSDRPDHAAAAVPRRGRAGADRGGLLPEPRRGRRLPGLPGHVVDRGGARDPGRPRRGGLPARGAGVSEADLEAVRARLLEARSASPGVAANGSNEGADFEHRQTRPTPGEPAPCVGLAA